VVELRFSYDMNGILEVEVTILHSGKKISEVFEQRPGTMTRTEISEAIARLRPLKIHPRDNPSNRARIERANRLWKDMRGAERDALSAFIDNFEHALASQDTARIKIACEDLESFMTPFFNDE
jgi:molecular chaperone HscC